MQPHTLWVKRDATEATVAKYLLQNKSLDYSRLLLYSWIVSLVEILTQNDLINYSLRGHLPVTWQCQC